MPKIFYEKEYRNKFMGLLIPITIQEVLVIFISTISVLMLGAVDQDAMSGVSIANNIFFLFNSVVSGIMLTGSILCAQFYGKKDIKSVNQTFYLSIKLAIILSLIFFVLAEAIPAQLLNIFAPGETVIINHGVKYLRIFATTFIFRGISGMYYYILKNLKKSKEIIIISIISLTINLGISSLLIFAFNYKEVGAANGIAISRLIEMILAIILVRKARSVKFTLHDFLHTDSLLLTKFIKHLIPLFICKTAWALGSLMISVFLGSLGADVIAATSLWNIARNIVICVPCGAGGAAAILIGQELGSNKLQSAAMHGKQILRFTFLVGILDMIIFAIVSVICLGIANNVLSSNAREVLIYMTIIYTPTFLFQAYNAVMLDGIFSAGGDTIFVSLDNSLPYWLVVVPLGFLSTALKLHPLLIFFFVSSEEIVKFLPNVLRYRKKIWVRNIVNVNE